MPEITLDDFYKYQGVVLSRNTGKIIVKIRIPERIGFEQRMPAKAATQYERRDA